MPIDVHIGLFHCVHVAAIAFSANLERVVPLLRLSPPAGIASCQRVGVCSPGNSVRKD